MSESHVVWKRTRAVPNRSSPILVGDHIYMCSDSGAASCVEAKTGREIWRQRIDGRYSASPIHAEGRIYFFSEEGDTTVIKSGTELVILGKSQLDGGFMSSPAIAGKAFFLRTKTHLYRIEK